MCKGTNQYFAFARGFMTKCVVALAGNRPYRGQDGEEERLGCTLVTSFSRDGKLVQPLYSGDSSQL